MDSLFSLSRASAVVFSLIFTAFAVQAQPCSTSNASGCACKDGTTDCDLLPDIKISRDLLLDAAEQPEVPGELGVSVSTTNTGHGPLRVVATDYYVCGSDTIHSPGGLTTCSDGSAPRQLIQQRIYHKNPDGSMTYTDRWAGSMTYHPSHGHMHVDDWGVYSLRTPTADPNPLNWPVVADGAKLGFCLMDYGSCSYYYGHCRDAADNILTTDAPNYGLGGGGYSCGLTNQGISAGYTDIYYHYLDGMQIDIPETVCNGTYMLVVHVDPYNYFLEEDETNNVEAVPITLTEQGSITAFDLTVEDGGTTICGGDVVEISSPLTGSDYLWSNGATTPTISVSDPGSYSVTVTSPTCGTVTSNTIDIAVTEVVSPSAEGDSVCDMGSMVLSAGPGATGSERWYDTETGGTLLHTGADFTTPVLSSTTSYWVERDALFPGLSANVGETDHVGTSIYSGNSFNGGLLFNALAPFTLKSAKVYTDQAGDRTIEILDAGGNLVAARDVTIPLGESRISLDLEVPAGSGYLITTRESENIANFGFSSPRLQRTNDGSVAYPHTVPDVVEIYDSNFGPGLYYYFYDWDIQQEDLTCTSSRSEAVALVRICTGLNNPLEGALSLSPNPASDRAALRFTLREAQDLNWQLLDLQGRVLQSGGGAFAAGAGQVDLNLEGLAAGTYLVALKAGERVYRERLLLAPAGER